MIPLRQGMGAATFQCHRALALDDKTTDALNALGRMLELPGKQKDATHSRHSKLRDTQDHFECATGTHVCKPERPPRAQRLRCARRRKPRDACSSAEAARARESEKRGSDDPTLRLVTPFSAIRLAATDRAQGGVTCLA